MAESSRAKKWAKLMQGAKTCPRGMYHVDETFLKDLDDAMEQTGSTVTVLPKEAVFKELGMNKEQIKKLEDLNNATWCMNQKIAKDPNLKKYGIKLGYTGDSIKISRIDWDEHLKKHPSLIKKRISR